MNIGWFFYIGGNDSMDTVSKLSRYAEKIGSDIRVIGEPKTILRASEALRNTLPPLSAKSLWTPMFTRRNP